jgi:hypothetical protein
VSDQRGRPDSFKQEIFYSGKARKHSIKYELGVHPTTGKIVWVGGPAPGSMPDLTLSRHSSILDLVKLFEEFILADKGYIGEFQIVAPIKKL